MKRIQHPIPVPSPGVTTRSQRQARKSVSFSNTSIMLQVTPDIIKASPPKGRSRAKAGKPKISKPKTKPKKVGGRKFKLAYTNRKNVKLLSESGNNELSKDDLSFLTDEEKLLLSSWGLPSSILSRYRSKGVTSLFPWQLECLANERVLEGNNLLYSAPTSAGKTLVAEILMIKRVLELGKKAIMILPFVSVAREKMYSLQEIFGDVGVRVEGFMGSYNPPGGFSQVDIAICTIEKANSLINRLLEEGGLGQLGTIVVDELHLLGDPNRGYLLELLLTKIRYVTSKKRLLDNSITSTDHEQSSKINIQIVGMSATLPNLDLLAKWLDAELVISNFRPVPLSEGIKIGETILDATLQPIRPVFIDEIPMSISDDPDHVIYISLATVLAGHSILIFCPTKQMCETMAVQIAREFYSIGHPLSQVATPEISENLRNQLNGVKIGEVLGQLAQSPAGLDENLKRAVSFGVSFHHAGLTFDERDIIESAFKRGILRVLTATSTLSAGVNLPARRVIIIPPHYGDVDILTYRQMSGRAGRKGVDTEGESILIANIRTQGRALKMIQSSLPAVNSALIGENGDAPSPSLKRALLEVIASGVVRNPKEVNEYARCTLLSKSLEYSLGSAAEDEEKSDSIRQAQEAKEASIKNCLKFLAENDFIRLNIYESEEKEDEYMTTQLGLACLSSSLSPDEGIQVYKELEKARQCFVLENELHVIYQVTPIYIADQWRNLDWSQFLRIWQSLSPDKQKVGELVGVNEGFIVKAMMGTVSYNNPFHAIPLTIHQRFYTALALSDLVNELPISGVCEKYSVNKGTVQNLQQAASTFAGMVTAFCGRLGWSNLELLLSQFQDRLQFGVQRELIDLVRLSLLNGQRARVLYDAGIKTVAELASTEPAQVCQIFHKAGPFSSAIHGGKSSNSIWMLGKQDVGEADAAQMIVEEARQFLQIELGLPANIRFNANQVKEKLTVNEISTNSRSQHSHNASLSKISDHNSSATSTATELNHSSEKSNDSVFQESIVLDEQENDDRIRSYSNILQVSAIQRPHDSANTSSQLLQDHIEQKHQNSGLLHHNNSTMNLGNDSIKHSTPVQGSTVLHTHHRDRSNTPKIMHEANHYQLHNGHEKFDFEKEFLQNKFDSSEIDTNKQECEMLDLTLDNHNPIVAENQVINENLHEMFMDSMTSFMEVSLIISESEPEDVNLKQSPEPETGYTTPSILTESILATAAAIADYETSSSNSEGNISSRASMFNSRINTDDIPTDGSSSDEIIEPSPESIRSTSSTLRKSQTSMSKLHLQSQQFTRTGNSVIDQNTSEDIDRFESINSSRTPRKRSDTRKRTPEHFVLCGKKIKLEFIDTLEYIPPNMMKGTNELGISFTIEENKRSTSVTRPGIGCRVLGIKTPCAKTSNENILHRLAIYNNHLQIVWLYEWADTKSHRPRMRTANNDLKIMEIFEKIAISGKRLIFLDAKEKLRKLMKYCSQNFDMRKIPPAEKIIDPKIGAWLINFEEDNGIDLESLVSTYFNSELIRDLKRSNLTKEVHNAYCSVKLMETLKPKLIDVQLWTHFKATEMPSIMTIFMMESNGFRINVNEIERLKQILEFKSALLELRAYQLAGKQFHLSSPKEIQQILFREIGLKQPGRRGTGKDILEKIDHPLPKVIIEWRKVTAALHKFIIPFQQARNLETGRVHGHYSHLTLTGRVVMSEPSIQCVPRDFDLKLSFTSKEIEDIRHDCNLRMGSKVTGLLHKLENGVIAKYHEECNNVSMRNSFIPCSDDFIIVSLDFSQLELRILAHLCGDQGLIEVLNKEGGDIFKSMASQWKNIPENEITSEIRQSVKAIAYGIIYGMGTKTLAEQMNVEESEAYTFMTQFMRTFPRIRRFIDSTMKFCRENGYVETILGRKRYLENINSRDNAERAQAERQAVNSKIQGSASDLVKTAMNRVMSRLCSLYPTASQPVRWIATTNSNTIPVPYPADLLDEIIVLPILNLHDELMFEVRKSYLPVVSHEIKKEMESCLKLDVRLPVVLKTGPSWGQLKPYLPA